jgi:PGDYG protein
MKSVMKTLTNIDLTTDHAAKKFVKHEIVHVTFATTSGELTSREGINRYRAGDALITSESGERWCVSRDRFELKYEQIAEHKFRAKPVSVLAKQMLEPFAISRSAGGDVLQGAAQDWLLQYAPGDYGIVENARFARVYRLLAES